MLKDKHRRKERQRRREIHPAEENKRREEEQLKDRRRCEELCERGETVFRQKRETPHTDLKDTGQTESERKGRRG